jgi:hypothetical protein
MPVIPALRRLRQEDWEFEDQLGVHSKALSKNKQIHSYVSVECLLSAKDCFGD